MRTILLAAVLVSTVVVLIYVDMWRGFLLDRVDTYWGIVQRDDGSSVGRMRSRIVANYEALHRPNEFGWRRE
jgi:hypothetical protein